MTSPGWLTRSLADVPADDGWLGPGEIEVLAGLGFEKRRADWRLGRFAAKTALAVWLGVQPGRVEVASGARRRPRAPGSTAAAPRSRCHSAIGRGARSLWWAKRTLRSAAISS